MTDSTVIPASGGDASSLVEKIKYVATVLQFVTRSAFGSRVVVVPWVNTAVEQWAFLFLTYFNHRTILVVHNPVRGRYAEMRTWAYRKLHSRAGLVVVHRKELIANLAAAVRVAVVEHPTYLSWWRLHRQRLPPKQEREKPFALFIGTLRADKGVEELPALASALHEYGMGLRIGCGKIPEEYRHTLMTNSDIAIAGDANTSLSDDELALLLHESQVLVVPYRNVTTSGSIILAATAGIPIVGYRCETLEQLVGSAACVEIGDVADLARRASQMGRPARDLSDLRLREIELDARSSWIGAVATVIDPVNTTRRPEGDRATKSSPKEPAIPGIAA